MAEDKKFIYFDNASTTSVSAEVLNVYEKYIREFPGNPSSAHFLGQKDHRELDLMRARILKSLNLPNHEVIFTSGATEANNLALKGIAHRYKNRGNEIIVSEIEHSSILQTAKQLETEGFEIKYAHINQEGKVDLDELKSLITDKTILVSIMAVSNELGSINEIEKIAEMMINYPKAYFHVDAVQAIGKTQINYKNVDLITFTGHKIHGLKSGGVLLKKKNIEITPLLNGGGQENNLRSGTNDLPMAAAIATALESSNCNILAKTQHVKEIRDYIWDEISILKNDFAINSSANSSPYIFSFSSINKKASVIVEALSNAGIYVSSTSACYASHSFPSVAVLAMTHDEKRAHNTIRLSFSEENTLDEAKLFINKLKEIVGGIK